MALEHFGAVLDLLIKVFKSPSTLRIFKKFFCSERCDMRVALFLLYESLALTTCIFLFQALHGRFHPVVICLILALVLSAVACRASIDCSKPETATSKDRERIIGERELAKRIGRFLGECKVEGMKLEFWLFNENGKKSIELFPVEDDFSDESVRRVRTRFYERLYNALNSGEAFNWNFEDVKRLICS